MKKTNEECIFRTKDGQLRIRVAVGTTGIDRVQKQRTMPRAATMSEAIIAREEIRKELKDPALAAPGLSDIVTVGDYALLWFEQKAPTLAPTTRSTYYVALDTRILPYLGDVRVDNCTRQTVQAWVAWMDQAKQADGSSYARSTRRGWWRVGKQMLLDMQADLGLDRPLVDRVKPPKRGGGQSRCSRTLTAHELAEFVEVARKLDPQRYAEILTLATTGMRAGELYGLKWADVDYEGQLLHVRRSAARGHLREQTKTGAARSVPLAPRLARALREQHKALITGEHPGLSTGLVFPSDAGTPRTSSSLHKPMKAISQVMELDYEVTPQVMRRSFNTSVLAAGANEIVLRSVMGHSSSQMTELYAGVEAGDKHAAIGSALPGLFGAED